jgi:uncharacterized protein YbjT (DUF2867 family)
MILLAGTTGELGRKIARELVRQRRLVAALSRNEETDRICEALMTVPVRGDLTNRASLSQACAGKEIVICSATAIGRDDETIEEVDGRGVQNLIAAASAAKVKHFVFLSFPEMKTQFELQTAKREAEAALEHGDMPYTVLQPWYFSSNWVWGEPFGYSRTRNRFTILGTGNEPNSWISPDDVAAVTAGVAGNPAYFRKKLEFGGAVPMTPRQIVDELKQAGANPEVDTVTVDDLQKAFDAAPDPRSRSISALRLEAAKGKIVQPGAVASMMRRDLRTELAASLRPMPSINFRDDDLIVAYGKPEAPTYIHVPAELYRNSPMTDQQLRATVDTVKDAAVVATFPKGGHVARKTVYLNLDKLRPVIPQGPQPPRTKVEPGSHTGGWQVVLQNRTAGHQDSLFLLKEEVLRQCTEFPSNTSVQTEDLDRLVGEGGVVAWLPLQGGTATGCACYLLNLTSFA